MGNNHKPLHQAFTLIELLVVLTIIGILAALMLPALAQAKNRSQTVRCLGNLKQFGVASQLYAVDHSDRIVPNHGGKDIALERTWVRGWLGLPGPDCTNTVLLEESLLGPYIKAPAVWHCPVARPVDIEGMVQPRVRTVSLNCFMGVDTNSLLAACYPTMGSIARPGTADALTFVDERVDTINDGTFSLQWDFDPSYPELWELRDKPSPAHQQGTTFAYADGHAARHRWTDSRTLAAPRDDALMAGNVDILWMQQHSTWRAKP
jgi:prepilin-type N-terminal cleavage/methylation domain-containing protein/prepilin-type processing-associated H-X9-DG protein